MITAGRSGAVVAYVPGYIGVTVAPVCSVPRVAIRVGVFGAGGRMGATVCEAVAGDPELELVAAVDPSYEGQPSVEGVAIAAAPRALADANAQVAVDFTAPDAAMGNLRWCAMHEVHAVVGTTGLGEAELDELRHLFTASNCIVAPNFAIGAVLMMRFAELAAPFFETAEIIELHHNQKIDAPSGTAMMTAQRMAEASSDWAADPTRSRSPQERGVASGPATSTCTPCACVGSSRTKRCCSAPPASRSRSATTRTTAARSCPGCSSP